MEQFLNRINAHRSDGELRNSILRTLAYFNVFDHPLTAGEIVENCDIEIKEHSQLRKEIDALCAEGIIVRNGVYYSPAGSKGVEKRREAVRLHPYYLRKAYRYSRLIGRFPFVRGVSISGSVAKGGADRDADIDYFIITAPGRLWICRTLLTLYKKVVLLNSRKYFCINYFVDTENMQIPDKNIFTATEIAFLLPTYNHASYEAFMKENEWVKTYYPNKKLFDATDVRKPSSSPIKKLAEFLLSGPAGNYFEKSCMRITELYRKRRFRHLNEIEYKHRLRATKGVSKHHPNSFQTRVLSAYEKNLNTIVTGQALRPAI
jgi:predicted nucleotidyltransferase